MNVVILLTAGNSKRMKGKNKIFCKIKEKPLIFYTILPFEKCKEINKIVIVTKEKFKRRFERLIKKYNFKKIKHIIKGGKERQNSAYFGLKFLSKIGVKKGDLVLFHNGANPLLLQSEIKKVIKEAKKYKCVILAQKARDTIKEASKDSFIEKTLNREKIYLAQTPQVIEYELAKKAFKKAEKDKFLGTDDASLVERLGIKVKIVPCSYKNIKVTFPEDLKIVESFL